jgi:NAD(P)-dependent dehydrogenase (short-subunit alcohol dehydrogenase family)
VECGRYGIRVNAVSHHAVMGSDFGDGERAMAMRSLLGSKTPLGRPCLPEDVARAALFFASPIAEYVTGHMLILDGGVGVKFPFTPGADPTEAHLV